MESLISALSAPSLFLPLSPHLHLSSFPPLFSLPLSLSLIHLFLLYSTLFSPPFLFSSSSSSSVHSDLLVCVLCPPTHLRKKNPSSSLPPSCPPRSIATGNYCQRPEGGAHTQRAERDGVGAFHLSNENITGDSVGGDNLWRSLYFCLACLFCFFFCKMSDHPSHPLRSSSPGRCGSATAMH